ncbi:MAG: hypothetical protein P4N24_08535 [Acidobacteriota bacterium]|jgi:hypothetical protein|nr:hypothetical protein [Acidobacteriota bacterium]
MKRDRAEVPRAKVGFASVSVLVHLNYYEQQFSRVGTELYEHAYLLQSYQRVANIVTMIEVKSMVAVQS